VRPAGWLPTQARGASERTERSRRRPAWRVARGRWPQGRAVRRLSHPARCYARLVAELIAGAGPGATSARRDRDAIAQTTGARRSEQRAEPCGRSPRTPSAGAAARLPDRGRSGQVSPIKAAPRARQGGVGLGAGPPSMPDTSMVALLGYRVEERARWDLRRSRGSSNKRGGSRQDTWRECHPIRRAARPLRRA